MFLPNLRPILAAALPFLLLLSACGDPKPAPDNGGGSTTTTTPPTPNVSVPTFSADTAYAYIQKQVDFGPRVPKTKEHAACLAWIVEQLTAHGAQVRIQEGVMVSHLDPKMPIKNVIATINPDEKNRVLLCAHWDTRYVADQDKDSTRKNSPILGADDGGSGVGVLIEIARIVKANPIKLGIDIVLFDVEDQGEPNEGEIYRKTELWCLGSQYWSKNNGGYRAKFGILLDMVGSRGATFPKEGGSMKHAGIFVDKVWREALNLGYSDFFIKGESKAVIDDHVFVNEFAKIPTLDIINLPVGGSNTFGLHWHTQNDNMSIIDRNTLRAVGQTLLQVLYKEAAGAL